MPLPLRLRPVTAPLTAVLALGLVLTAAPGHTSPATGTSLDGTGDQFVTGKGGRTTPDLTSVTYHLNAAGKLKVVITANGMRKKRSRKAREEYSAPIYLTGDHQYTITHTRAFQPRLLDLASGQRLIVPGAKVMRRVKKNKVVFLLPVSALRPSPSIAAGGMVTLRKGKTVLGGDIVTPGDPIPFT